MTEEEIRSIALFFYFLTLNSEAAVEASASALAEARDLLKREPQRPHEEILISAMVDIMEDLPLDLPKSEKNDLRDFQNWGLPKDIDFNFWREFHRRASREEISALLWSGVLGFSHHGIAVSVGLQEGTVRYRLGQAYRKLGGTFGRMHVPGTR